MASQAAKNAAVTTREKNPRRRPLPSHTIAEFGKHIPGALYAFRRSPEGESQVTYVSDGIKDIYGCSPEEIYADLERAHSRVHPDDRAAFEDSIVASFDALDPWRYEFRVVLPERGVRHISAAASPEPQADGSVLWFGHLIDVTTFKLEQEKAYQSARRYEQVLESLGDGVWFYDVDSNVITFSEAWWDMLGYEEDEIGASIDAWYEYIHAEDLAPTVAALASLFNGEIPHASFEYRILTKDGGYKWVLGRGVVTAMAENGYPTTVSGTYMDITARKESEWRLRLRAQIIEAVPIGIFVAEPASDGCQLRYVNEAFCRIFEVSREQALGSSWGLTNNAVNPEAINQHVRGDNTHGRPSKQLWQYIRQDGSTAWRTINLVPVDAVNEHARVIGITEDVTEDFRVRQALIDAREQAVAANEAKSNFLAHVSHELRTPLHAIMGLSELLASDDRLDEHNRTHAVEIHRGAEHLLTLIADVIDLSAIEAGRIALSVERVDIADVIADVVRLARPFARERQITLLVDEGLREAAFANCDSTRTIQVLLNLVSNAIKYNRVQGSVTLKRMPTRAGFMRVAIADTGPGLETSEIERLFEPFDRLGREFSQVEGSGIGLLIARGLAEAMGGSLGVHSVPGEGSTFWLEIPEAAASQEVLPNKPHDAGQTVPSIAPAPDCPILVAEDNELSRSVFRSQLERLGYVPTIVADGNRAWEEWLTGRYPVLITDVHMPGLDGLELVRRIRAREADMHGFPTYIIGASANAMKEAAREAAGYGMDNYITKPVSIATLQSALAGNPGATPTSGRRDAGAATSLLMTGSNSATPLAQEIVDLRVLEDLVGSDPLTVRVFVGRFLETTDEGVRSLVEALNSSDLRTAEEVAHRLKASARTLGAAQLAGFFEEVERSALTGELGDDPGRYRDETLRQYEIVRTELASLPPLHHPQ